MPPAIIFARNTCPQVSLRLSMLRLPSTSPDPVLVARLHHVDDVPSLLSLSTTFNPFFFPGMKILRNGVCIIGQALSSLTTPLSLSE